jgi:hypothetical protein
MLTLIQSLKSTMNKIASFGLLISFITLISLVYKPTNTATEFIESLTSEQKSQVLLDVEDERRENWHFLPWKSFEREGLGIFELTDTQKNLLFKHLRAHLSESGFLRVKNTMSLEKVLQELGGDPEYRDPEKYYIAFYGDPAKDKVWAWAFEGHHISLNFTIVDHQVSYTPKFFGANPAEIREGSRKGERIFKEEEDLGFELVNSFDAKKKEQVIFSAKTFGEIVSKVNTRVDPMEPVGIKISDMNPMQKKILWKLIDAYLSDMPNVLAKKRSKQIKDEEEAAIHFGWAGATSLGEPHYYRIQGKTFLIEFDNTQNDANHIHTVWRDFDGDFGRDLIKEHYANDH